jgi:hypothetical protein
MKPARSRVLGCALAASSTFACSWTRFDDFEKDAPVVMLERPKQLDEGFGVSLAWVPYEGGAELFVSGAATRHGIATFALGNGESPREAAADTQNCTKSGVPCALASSIAATRVSPDGSDSGRCVVAGLGQLDGELGLLTRCRGKVAEDRYLLQLPTDVERAALGPVKKKEYPVFALAADTTDKPLVAASWPERNRAWAYVFGRTEPLDLALPAALDRGDRIAPLAVLVHGDERLVAHAAPNAGSVALFRVTDEDAYPVGCLHGAEKFGRALASGRVDQDDVEDLAVADSRNVIVYAGAALFALERAPELNCSGGALPAGAVLASFGCGQEPDVDGCRTSEFGAALAIGDLDGDGDGEVAVGAPRMDVRGQDARGAVLVYDVEADAPNTLADVLFTSSGEAEDYLGAALAAPRIKDRNVLAAGAPGGGKAALFFCTALGTQGPSKRCSKD